jgi:DNA-binding GntR family transcriptional regulator
MERYERLYMADRLGVERSAQQHEDLLQSLRRNDLGAATRVIERHWDDSVAHLLRALGEQP